MKTNKKSASQGEENIRYAIVREEKHEHLYAKAEGEQAYFPVACLGGYPKDMFCEWQIPATKFVQHKFRTQKAAEKYVEQRLGLDAMLHIFYDL